MKKIIALLLILAFTCSLISCENINSSDVAETTAESLENRIASKVKSRIMVEVALSYDIQGVPTVTTYVNPVNDNKYEVTGKVSVRDKYGDSYTGKYDAIIKYDPEIDNISISDLDIGTLYQD